LVAWYLGGWYLGRLIRHGLDSAAAAELMADALLTCRSASVPQRRSTRA
jgi:hypothetical protein